MNYVEATDRHWLLMIFGMLKVIKGVDPDMLKKLELHLFPGPRVESK